MENVAVQKKQSAGEVPSVVRVAWNPFWFMRDMFGWGRAGDAPSFDVKETNDAYVYKIKLALPDQADAARVKVELGNGELTLTVPKAAVAAPAPALPPPRTRRTKGGGRGSAASKPRRGARPPSRRG